MKPCNKCKRVKELTAYHPDSRNKDGHQGKCIECRTEEKRAQRQARIAAGSVVSIKEKTCNKCKITKQAIDFFKDAGFADGLASLCKECKQATTYAWRDKKRTEYNAYMKKYRQTHPEKYSQARNRGLKHRYGIDQFQYNNMLIIQSGLCAICKKVQTDKPFVVDHDHETGKVRGLIHSGCNVAISILDNPELLQQAIDYKKQTS